MNSGTIQHEGTGVESQAVAPQAVFKHPPHLVRPLPRQPGLLLLVLVDRPRANLALARFRMAEAQRNLA